MHRERWLVLPKTSLLLDFTIPFTLWVQNEFYLYHHESEATPPGPIPIKKEVKNGNMGGN